MRCSILATFSEADTLEAAMRAMGLARLTTTQKGQFRANSVRSHLTGYA